MNIYKIIGIVTLVIIIGASAFYIGKNYGAVTPKYPVGQAPTDTQTTKETSVFTASPTKGTAPLTVRFAQTATEDSRALLDYGDGTSCAVSGSSESANCANKFVHVYKTPGTYTATLRSSTGTDAASRPPFGTVTITVTGTTAACPPATAGENPKPIIRTISPSSGPVGTKITLTGCGFRGFEGDTDLWFTNSKEVKGVLYGNANNTDTSITATIPAKLCTQNTSYQGIPCPSYMDITPGAYSVTESGYGTSNAVTFTVTSQ